MGSTTECDHKHRRTMHMLETENMGRTTECDHKHRRTMHMLETENMRLSRLFPGQIKADSIKKKLSLTPQTSPRPSSDISRNSQHQKVLVKPVENCSYKPSEILKKPSVDSPKSD